MQDALLALAERTLRALPPASDAASSPPLGDAFRRGPSTFAATNPIEGAGTDVV